MLINSHNQNTHNMITLKEYLDNIAKAILEPVGRYDGYSGMHRQDTSHETWKNWEKIASMTYTHPVTEEVTLWYLLWIQDKGTQGSWWVKQATVIDRIAQADAEMKEQIANDPGNETGYMHHMYSDH